MRADAPVSPLKSLPGFEPLTAAESAVFDHLVDCWSFHAGDRISPERAVLVIAEGVLDLHAGPAGPPFASEGRGGLLGEVELYAPDPLPIAGHARSDGMAWTLSHRALKTAFHYSRPGAVKFMVACARSLSRKIRSATRLLPAAAGDCGEDLELPLAEHLGDPDLKRLRAFSESRDYGEGEVVFREGEPGNELFVVSDGEVEIVRESPGHPTRRLVRVGPGGFFGEIAFVDDQPRSATARALSKVHIQVLPAGTLEQALETNISVALYLTNVICKIMARRLDATVRRIGSA